MMAGDGKSFLALVNGLTRHDYYSDTEITDEFLHHELYPDLPDDEFMRLIQKARGITNVGTVWHCHFIQNHCHCHWHWHWHCHCHCHCHCHWYWYYRSFHVHCFHLVIARFLPAHYKYIVCTFKSTLKKILIGQ